MINPEVNTMFQVIEKHINSLDISNVPEERKTILKPLIEYIIEKQNTNESIRLNFICTHNSRRSHLSQVWAHVMAYFYTIDKVTCYSGGTEATALFPKAAEALKKSGTSHYWFF